MSIKSLQAVFDKSVWHHLTCHTHKGSIDVDLPSGKDCGSIHIRESGRPMLARRFHRNIAWVGVIDAIDHQNAGWGD